MSINEARPIMRESEIKHRHVSHLYGLHPCSEISPLKTPELAEFVICGTKPKNVLVAGKDMTASFTFDGTKSYLN